MAHTLPDLPYAHDALEPHIDAQTMEIHHGKHHAAYVAKLNAAIEGNADDGTVRATIGMERTPTERAVAALNSSNPGDHPPRQAAGGIGLGEGDLGPKVGIEGNDRDVESGDHGGPSGSTNGIFRRGKRLYRSRAIVARGSQRFTQCCDIGSEGKESALKISDRGAEPGALVFEHAK